LAERFLIHMLTRNIRIEEDLVDQLFNSTENCLARTSRRERRSVAQGLFTTRQTQQRYRPTLSARRTEGRPRVMFASGEKERNVNHFIALSAPA